MLHPIDGLNRRYIEYVFENALGIAGELGQRVLFRRDAGCDANCCCFSGQIKTLHLVGGGFAPRLSQAGWPIDRDSGRGTASISVVRRPTEPLYRVVLGAVNGSQHNQAALAVRHAPNSSGLVTDVGPRIAFTADRQSAVTNEVGRGNMPPARSAVNPEP